jgi:hypothetical protein
MVKNDVMLQWLSWDLWKPLPCGSQHCSEAEGSALITLHSRGLGKDAANNHLQHDLQLPTPATLYENGCFDLIELSLPCGLLSVYATSSMMGAPDYQRSYTSEAVRHIVIVEVTG